MKSLAEVAGILQTRMGNLNDQSLNRAMTTMFGSDAMRTGIALMDTGERGLRELQETIGNTSAQEKLNIQMQGLEAATGRVAAAFESLKLALGSAGILTVFTAVTEAIAGLVNAIADLPPIFHTVWLGAAAFAAALGPMILIVMTIAGVALPLFITRMGFLARAVVFLINPFALLSAMLLRFAASTGIAGTAVAGFMTTLARFLGWIGLIVIALSVLYSAIGSGRQANSAATQASEAASRALDNQRNETLRLARATGQLRQELIATMRVNMANANARLTVARNEARATAAQIDAVKAERDAALRNASGGREAGYIGAAYGPQIERLENTLHVQNETMQYGIDTVRGYLDSLKDATAVAAGPTTFTIPEDPERKRKRRNSGPSAAELAAMREEIRLQQALAVARAKGDEDAERAIQHQIDLNRRIEEYDEAGLTNAQARVAAARDMAELRTAEAEEQARNVAISEEALVLELARIREDHIGVEQLERQNYLRERINHWRGLDLPLAEAEARATSDALQMDEARLAMRQRLNAEAERSRQIELARLRGESDRTIRGLERADELERRAREYAERNKISEDEAREFVSVQMAEEDAARLQGDFRRTFRDGVRAAMEGDLKSFVKDWWTERLSKSLEDALNSVADMLYRLFQSAMSQAGQGQGGLLGGIFGGAGGLFGLGSSEGGGNAASLTSGDPRNLPRQMPFGFGSSGTFGLPGFANGGGGVLGGLHGLDTNLLSLNGNPIARVTRGEHLRITPDGGGEGGHGSGRVHVLVEASPLLMTRIVEGDETAAVAGSHDARSRIADKQSRVIP
jgi:hypothetical protein